MQLFFREKGNPEKPPLVILHGLWGASDNWLPVANRLTEDFHIFLPDFRNHGNSPHADRHDYKILCEDISTFIESLHLPHPPFIAGHSMGGRVLMQLLLEKPETAAGAAIIDICPESHSASNAIHQDLLNFILSFPLTDFKERKALTTAVTHAFSRPEEQQLLLKNIQRSGESFRWKINPQALKENLSGLLHSAFPANTCPYLSPLLFIRGSKSDYVPATLGEQTLRLFPAAQLVTLPEASHRLHAEQPDALARTLHDFFSQFFIPLR